jgi:hypothetical protein
LTQCFLTDSSKLALALDVRPTDRPTRSRWKRPADWPGYHRINTLLLRGSNIGALKALVRGDFVGLSRIGKTLFNRVLLRSTQVVKFLIAYSREIALVYAHLVLAGDHIPEKVSQRFACIWIDEITNLFARVVRDKLYTIACLRLSAQLGVSPDIDFLVRSRSACAI